MAYNTFQPSSLSYGCGDYGDLALAGYGDIARANRGIIAAGGGVLKDVAVSVLPGASLVEEATAGLKRRLGEAEGEATKWKQRYFACKKRREKKGKGAYPGDPGKWPYTDCREKHKEWKHFENKAARLAKELQKKLGDKGKLDPEAEADLVRIQARPIAGAEAEFNEAMKSFEQNRKKGKKGKKPNKDNFLAASVDPELAAQTLEGDSDGFPTILLALGGLVAVGGIAYYVLAD